MKRDIEIEFSRWKERTDRKPLVLMGARQVGKTWLMENFGRENFAKVHYFDFAATPDLATIFISIRKNQSSQSASQSAISRRMVRS